MRRVKISLNTATAVLALWTGLAGAGELTPERIDLFVLEGAQLSAEHADQLPVAIHEVDAAMRWEHQVSARLPHDENQARKAADHLYRNLHQSDRDRLVQGWQALLLAHRTGIDRVPAVVFDGEAVVYGTTNLKQATTLWRSWKAAEN